MSKNPPLIHRPEDGRVLFEVFRRLHPDLSMTDPLDLQEAFENWLLDDLQAHEMKDIHITGLPDFCLSSFLRPVDNKVMAMTLQPHGMTHIGNDNRLDLTFDLNVWDNAVFQNESQMKFFAAKTEFHFASACKNEVSILSPGGDRNPPILNLSLYKHNQVYTENFYGIKANLSEKNLLIANMRSNVQVKALGSYNYIQAPIITVEENYLSGSSYSILEARQIAFKNSYLSGMGIFVSTSDLSSSGLLHVGKSAHFRFRTERPHLYYVCTPDKIKTEELPEGTEWQEDPHLNLIAVQVCEHPKQFELTRLLSYERNGDFVENQQPMLQCVLNQDVYDHYVAHLQRVFPQENCKLARQFWATLFELSVHNEGLEVPSIPVRP